MRLTDERWNRNSDSGIDQRHLSALYLFTQEAILKLHEIIETAALRDKISPVRCCVKVAIHFGLALKSHCVFVRLVIA